MRGLSLTIRISVTYSAVSCAPACAVSDGTFGSEIRPRVTRYAIPIAVSTTPIGVSSNMPIGASPRRSIDPLTSRFVEVPTSVQTPPRIDA
jgi:hypothetical protein